jgi:hypothetical protein
MSVQSVQDGRELRWASDKCEFIDGLLPSTTCELMWEYVQLRRSLDQLLKPDGRVVGAPRLYMDMLTEALLVQQLPAVEKRIGEELWPSYSILRMHQSGAELPKHLDRPASEVAVSIALGGDLAWPLFLETAQGDAMFTPNPGDAVVYSGTVLPHWRTPYRGELQVQCVLFYVRKNGEYAIHKYSGRAGVGHPPVPPAMKPAEARPVPANA